jgi:nicotinate-nucleotide adenylyltransferase
MPKRIGIYGGTFDPPHVAHSILAQEALEALGLERLLWVLTPNPPHKPDQPITPLGHRVDMLRAALVGQPRFQISSVDIDRAPPHYAVDTVGLLAERYPGDEMVYVMGEDSLRDLPTWHRPDAFVEACDHLGVVKRPGVAVDLAALEAQIPGVHAKTRFVPAPLLEISATDIRQRARSGRPFRYFLLPAVYQIVIQRGLYLSST